MDINCIKQKLREEINLLRDEKGFLRAGVPRFNYLFGRDALISAWQLLDEEPAICRSTLKVLSELQGKRTNFFTEEEPGKILHEKSVPWHCWYYYGSVDSTPLYLIVFSLYFEKTQDDQFLIKHWPNIKMAANWIEKYGDKDKDYFLEYKRKTIRGLYHQGWKDGVGVLGRIKTPVAIVEAQGYQYLALEKIAWLAGEIFREDPYSNHLVERILKLRRRFNNEFWMPDKNYFALALDGNKEQKKAVTSNPGHLLFTGILEKEKERLLVERLFQNDLWTPFGIRTHSSLEPDFNPEAYHLGSVWPHDNWIIAQGLKARGYKKEYQRIKQAILLAYEKIGFLPEYYLVIDNQVLLKRKVGLPCYPRILDRAPCYPQAWASGALLNFLTEGVK